MPVALAELVLMEQGQAEEAEVVTAVMVRMAVGALHPRVLPVAAALLPKEAKEETVAPAAEAEEEEVVGLTSQALPVEMAAKVEKESF